ncbi:MAG: ACP S-malonyltransferase, partial [Pseudomonadota bacterium]
MIGLVFPGQGTVSKDILAPYAHNSTFNERYALVCEAIGHDPIEHASTYGADTLHRNKTSSLLAVLASVMALDDLRPSIKWPPHAFAGYSVGQWTALFAARAIDFPTLVTLVSKRAALMDHSQTSVTGQMLAVIGVGLEAVESVCAEIRGSGKYIAVSNYNASGQYTLAGEVDAVDLAEIKLADRAPKKIERLSMSGAWHCAMLADIAGTFREYLNSFTFDRPVAPVFDNVTGLEIADKADALRDTLTQHLTSPV